MKSYSHTQTTIGLPTFNSRVGSLAGILDAVLTDGFNSKTATSATAASDIVTFEFAAAHNFVNGDIISVSGATLTYAALNTEFTVYDVATLSFKVNAVGLSLPDGEATGTVVAKMAPLGFAKVTSSNLRSYRPASGKRDYIRIDDSYVNNTFVRGFTTMSDVNTGTGLFPEGGTTITLTSINVASNIATVVSPTAHKLSVGEPFTISGATPAGLNGLFYCRSVISSTSFTYSAVAADGLATGTISFINAGYIWKKGYTNDGVSITLTSIVVATNVATVISPTAHGLSRGTRFTIAGATPSGLNGTFTCKRVLSSTSFTYDASAADGTATGTITFIRYVNNKWYLFGDATYFHLFIESDQPDVYNCYSFGDLNTIRSGSATATLIGFGTLNNNYKITRETSPDRTYYAETLSANNSAFGNREHNTKDTTSTGESILSTDKIEQLYLSTHSGNAYTKLGTFPGLYVTDKQKSATFLSNSTPTIENGIDTDDAFKAFKTFLGGVNNSVYVGNLFVNTRTSL
jgi:hypothetical protein